MSVCHTRGEGKTRRKEERRGGKYMIEQGRGLELCLQKAWAGALQRRREGG